MKTIFILGLIILSFPYNSLIDNSKNEVETKMNNYFFEFDELFHYRTEINQSVLLAREGDKNLSPNEQLQIDLIIREKPYSIEDTLFITQLEDIGFKKKKIHKNQFEIINEVFKEKEDYGALAIIYECIPKYRDILIFKKNDKIIGMAKVCFSCDQNKIYGTTANTEKFGLDGDYAKLNELLNGKKVNNK